MSKGGFNNDLITIYYITKFIGKHLITLKSVNTTICYQHI